MYLRYRCFGRKVNVKYLGAARHSAEGSGVGGAPSSTDQESTAVPSLSAQSSPATEENQNDHLPTYLPLPTLLALNGVPSSPQEQEPFHNIERLASLGGLGLFWTPRHFWITPP